VNWAGHKKGWRNTWWNRLRSSSWTVALASAFVAFGSCEAADVGNWLPVEVNGASMVASSTCARTATAAVSTSLCMETCVKDVVATASAAPAHAEHV